MFNINFVKPAYKTVIEYLTIFFAFIFLNASTPFLAPFSFSAFNALSISGFNPVILGILCVLSCLLTGLTKIVLPITVAIFIMSLVFCFYRAKNIKPSFELIIYILLSLIYFILSKADNIYALIVYAIIMTLLSFLGVGACNFIFLKGIKYEPSAEETIFLFLAFSLLMLGALNTLPIFFVKIFVVYAVLFLSKCAGGTLTFCVSLLFGIPFSIYFSDIAYIAVFILLAGIGLIFNPITHYLSGVLILFFDYLFFALFWVYNSYGVYEFLSILLSVSAFLITPNKFYNKLKEYLCSKKSKTLIRKTVNENLLLIKERLYSVSEVFSEISSAMCEFKKNELKEDDAIKLISEETFKNCCISCSSYFRCKELRRNFSSQMKSDLNKFVKIGMAKGRVSFIDAPKSVTDCCTNVNGIIFAVNKELSEYRNILIDNDNFSLSRELVSKQAEGVSEVLKNLAY
ncbi:MAG: hypothetical protein J6V68_03590, partial [Clostridia bacterium]|nr:hypothetical protein [Clostridia bacterium]